MNETWYQTCHVGTINCAPFASIIYNLQQAAQPISVILYAQNRAAVDPFGQRSQSLVAEELAQHVGMVSKNTRMHSERFILCCQDDAPVCEPKAGAAFPDVRLRLWDDQWFLLDLLSLIWHVRDIVCAAAAANIRFHVVDSS